MTKITDIYKAQGMSDREIEVRDVLADLYSLPLGRITQEHRRKMREFSDELEEFIAARKLRKKLGNV